MLARTTAALTPVLVTATVQTVVTVAALATGRLDSALLAIAPAGGQGRARANALAALHGDQTAAQQRRAQLADVDQTERHATG